MQPAPEHTRQNLALLGIVCIVLGAASMAKSDQELAAEAAASGIDAPAPTVAEQSARTGSTTGQ